MIALLAALPVEVAGTTIDRQCGSSLQAVNFGAQEIRAAPATS
jgi:acetyl-CoA acetyltransferase